MTLISEAECIVIFESWFLDDANCIECKIDWTVDTDQEFLPQKEEPFCGQSTKPVVTKITKSKHNGFSY